MALNASFGPQSRDFGPALDRVRSKVLILCVKMIVVVNAIFLFIVVVEFWVLDLWTVKNELESKRTRARSLARARARKPLKTRFFGPKSKAHDCRFLRTRSGAELDQVVGRLCGSCS